MNISGILLDSLGLAPFSWGLGARDVVTTVPSSAQIIDQRSFNVLENVPPANESNGTSVCPISLTTHLWETLLTLSAVHLVGGDGGFPR